MNNRKNKLRYIQVCVLSRSVMSSSLRPHGLYSPPGSSVHGIFQARILEWVAIPYSRKLSQPRGQTCDSWIGRWVLYHRAIREALWYIHSLGYIAGENNPTYMDRAHKDIMLNERIEK